MEPALALRGVSKEYRSGELRFVALRDVTIEVPRGQFVAIVGASGSGKSTLMNILGCLDRPTAGVYALAGQELEGLDADELAGLRSARLGFVFQGFHLLPRTSALENVEMPLVDRGMSAQERRERATRALALVGLGDRLGHTPAQLSGGQQQRVAIARALVTEPEVLLADEPTGNLDSRTSEELLAMLQWLNREHGLTIVLVTHEPDVAACASRVLTVRDGALVGDALVGAPRRAAAPPGPEPWRTSAEGAAKTQDAGGGLFGSREEPGGGEPLVSFSSVRLALRSLWRSKMRAALTALGILIGIAAVVTTSALGAGASARMQASMASLGANLLVVTPSSTNNLGARGAQGSGATLTDGDAEAIGREVPTVAAVAPVLAANVQLVAGANNASSRVTGTTTGYFRVRAWPAVLGALWGEAEQRSGTAACAIGQTVRSELFGAADPLGRELRVGRMPCTVVAVLAAKGQTGFGQDQDDAVVVPLSAFRSGIYRLPNNQVNAVMVTASAPEVVHRAQASITALLHQRHHLAPGAEDDFAVNNLSDIMNAFNAQTQIIAVLLLVVASVSLLVGGIGVMNIMLVSVTERTREIGIRLAIGARSRDILAQFLVEALVLALLGGAAGLLLGYAMGLALGRATQFTVRFQPQVALVALAVSGGIGVLFGLLPARRAARLDPIVALRHE